MRGLHVSHETRVLGAHHQAADQVGVVGHLSRELLPDSVQFIHLSNPKHIHTCAPVTNNNQYRATVNGHGVAL